MIIETPARLRELPSPKEVAPFFRRVLMVSPEYFRVEYAINPYMKTASGELQSVDPDRAHRQWKDLVQLYQQLGYPVDILPGQKGLPDMVFAANQSFPFWDFRRKAPAVLISQMRSEFRRAEVSFFQDWYAKQGYAVHLLETRNCTFEGNGDALLQQSEGLIWGGFGPRTSRASYEEVSRCTGFPVAVLELVSEHFYHLDTCFSILNDQTVAIVPEAFTEAGRQLIAAGFSQVIPIDQREALEAFAGNCHCPNGKDVILHPGSPKLMNLLKKAGFSVHELDTSEFLKSGGSVFCLKMMVF